MSSRAVIAALYRDAAAEYRPFFEGTRPWAELTMAMVDNVLARCEAASMAELRWRKESGNRQCLFGSKGCPPWQPRDCWGEHRKPVEPRAEAGDTQTVNPVPTPTANQNVESKQGAWEMFR